MKAELIAAFQLTLVPDKHSIQKGTDVLSTLRKNTGFCLCLMEVADDATLPVEIRQAALTQLKLAAEYRWEESERKKQCDLVQEPEKAEIRKYLFPAMLRCPNDNRFLKLYRAIIKSVVLYDYQVWLPTELIANSLLTDPTHLQQTLHFAMGIVEGFELNMDESRIYLSKFMVELCPILFKLVQTSPAQVLFLTVKICWKAFQMGVTKAMQQLSFTWIPLFCEVLKFYDPALAEKSSSFKRYTPEFYYFHTKKWAARIIYRFLSRHANINFEKQNKEFEDLFYIRLGPMVLESLLYELTVPAVPKTLYFIFKALQSICERRPNLIEPHVRDLLYVRLPQYLKLTPEDDELARTDPAEFFRKEEDPYQQFTNIKASATALWISLNQIGGQKEVDEDSSILSRGAGKYMMESMEFLRNQLSSANLLEKEMAMYLVCKLRSIITRNTTIKKFLPTLIATYVIPEFSNSEMLLRAKAVDMFTSYGDIDFPDDALLKIAVEGIYKCLAADPHKIVSLKAACAFSIILSHKKAVDMVKPFLNNILAEYIKLLDTFDNEDIIRSLETIVKVFSDCIAPFAVELIRHLSNIFLKYCKIDHEKSKEDNYEGDVEMAASGCLNAISIILNAPIPKETLPAIEELMIPVFSFCLTEPGNDHFLDSMDCMGALLYKLPNLSQRMWFFFPVIIYYIIGIKEGTDTMSVQLFNESQTEIFSNLKSKRLEEVDIILPVMRLFVYKGTEMIMGGQKDFFGQSLLLLLIELTDTIYRAIHVDEFEDVNNQKATATAMLTYLLEVVSDKELLVSMALNVVKANLRDETANSNVDTINIQLLSMCLYCAPVITIKDLDKEGIWAKAFTSILGNQNRLEHGWQKKRFVLALSNLIRNIRESSMLELLTPIVKMAEKQIHLISMIREEELKDDDEQSDGEDDEKTNSDEEDSLEGVFWDEQHDTYYFDKLENIDEVAYFEESIQQLQLSDPSTYERILKVLSEEEQRSLRTNLIQAKQAFVRQKQLRAEKVAASS